MIKKSKPTWNNLKDTFAYIFYQGKDSSQLLASHYLGNLKMHATTKEKALSIVPSILTIPRENLWVYPELQEIDRNPSFSLISTLKHWYSGITVEPPPSDKDEPEYKPLYPQDESGSVHRYSIKNDKRSLAQKTDIDDHQKRYDSLSFHHKQVEHRILYGVSRGAATTFVALAVNKYKDVKLCVLEGPPATISALIKSYFTKPVAKYVYNDFLSSYLIGGEHKTDKKYHAMSYVDEFPKDVPLVIVSSQKDAIVTHKSPLNLAIKVAASRLEAQNKGEKIAPVYFLQLDHSGHNQYYQTETSEDAIRYQNFIHAIYKKHDLPYVEEYALEGQKELDTADLINGLLVEQVKFANQFKVDKEKREQIRKEAIKNIRSNFEILETKIKEQPEQKEQLCRNKERASKICSQMSLYKKNNNPSWFFSSNTEIQMELEELTKPVYKK